MFNIGDKIKYYYIFDLPSGEQLKGRVEGHIIDFCPEDEEMIWIDYFDANGCLMNKKVCIYSLVKVE